MLSSLNTELKLVDRGTPEEPEPIDVIPNVRTATDTLFFSLYDDRTPVLCLCLVCTCTVLKHVHYSTVL